MKRRKTSGLGDDWLIHLLLQALPKLVPSFELVPWPSSLDPLDVKTERSISKIGSMYLARFEDLAKRYGFDWSDVYRNSGIGRERLSVAQQTMHLIPPGSLLLDVGCGRGYFTTALCMTHPTSRIVAVDRMDGYGREGWWSLCRQLWTATGCVGRVNGCRGELERLPFPEGSLDACLCVHALRNIPVEKRARRVSEIARVTKTGGYVVLAEFSPFSCRESGRVFLDMFSLKTRVCRGEYRLPTEAELRGYLDAEGMSIDLVRILDLGIQEPIWAGPAGRVRPEENPILESLIQDAKRKGILSSPTVIIAARRTAVRCSPTRVRPWRQVLKRRKDSP